MARSVGAGFIAADARGLFGSAFCDFGPDFVCNDTNGQPALQGMVTSIDKSERGLVTTLDETRHGLSDGDYVTFSEVQGLQGINNAGPFRVTVVGPFSFEIGDTTKFEGVYEREGTFQQVKMPETIHFKPLEESLNNPEFLVTDFAKFERPHTIHAAFQALGSFQDSQGRLPFPRNEEDAQAVLALAKSIWAKSGQEAELEDKVVLELAKQARGDLAPIVAFIGGFIGQEVLKAVSGKFHPLVQHLYIDTLEALPLNINDLPQSEFEPEGTRYDSQVGVFGKTFQTKLSNARQFLVGSGAIGCEMLKNWAMMGVATGPEGVIHVTDNDQIEKSNLNRQFLFRPKDVGKFKAETAAAAVSDMNPHLKGKIAPSEQRVGPDSEDVYDDAFFESLTGVTNALDNVQARQYMDRRCVYYEKPLLESGTLGTQLNTQVVVPHVTESYSSSQDPPEKSIPMCTLKNFPNAIEHTIAWAREKFDELFVKPAQNANQYLTTPDYVNSTLLHSGSVISQKEQISQIKDFLVDRKPSTFDACVEWARYKFEEDYANTIKQLLFSLPPDARTSTGQLFWSGPKRAPRALVFDPNNELHLSYIIAAANLHADNYGIKEERDPAVFKRILSQIHVPTFEPKSNVKVQTSDNDPSPPSEADGNGEGPTEEDVVEIAGQLPSPSSLAGCRLNPADFEKDVDENFHIDFIAAAANLRAENYSIPIADRLKIKGIAGKIIPALITSTSVASGLVCVELYKLVDDGVKEGATSPHQRRRTIEDYKNNFVNLALPFVASSEPIAPPKNKYSDKVWTLWDRFTIPGNPTLQQLITQFEEKEKLEISMVSQGVSMLFSPFAKDRKERLGMTMRQLIEHVSKKPVPAHVHWVVVEVMADDENGEDVEVPFLNVQVDG